MSQENIQLQAFARGVYKRAAEYGMEKEAFIAPALAYAAEFGLPLIGSVFARKYLPTAASALAKSTKWKWAAKASKGMPKFLDRPIASGMAVDMPAYAATSMVTSPVIQGFRNKFDPQPAEQSQT